MARGLTTLEMVQAGVENSAESPSSSSSSKKVGDKDADAADDATRASRTGFIINNNNNNGLLWARDHRTVTGLIFAGTLVACERSIG